MPLYRNLFQMFTDSPELYILWVELRGLVPLAHIRLQPLSRELLRYMSRRLGEKKHISYPHTLNRGNASNGILY